MNRIQQAGLYFDLLQGIKQNQKRSQEIIHFIMSELKSLWTLIPSIFAISSSETKLPEELKKINAQLELQKKLQIQVLKQLDDFFSSNGIDYIVMKFLPFDKNSHCKRYSSDIDILIKESDKKWILDSLGESFEIIEPNGRARMYQLA